MVGRLDLHTSSKNRPNGDARRRNSIRLRNATSKLPLSLIDWPQRSMQFRKTFS
jgi:hypothetical protein